MKVSVTNSVKNIQTCNYIFRITYTSYYGKKTIKCFKMKKDVIVQR